MAYAQFEDVQRRLRQFTIDDTSAVTAEDVDAILEDIDGAINNCLASVGVAAPMTEPPASVRWLRGVNADGAASTVLKSLFPDARGAGETPAYAFYEKRYTDALQSIKDGSGVPAGAATTSSSTQLPATYFTRNTEEEAELGALAGGSLFSVNKDRREF